MANVRFKLRIIQNGNLNEQIKTAQKILMDKKLRETTNLCAEIMNSRRQVKGKLGLVVQIDVNIRLNLSITAKKCKNSTSV